MEKMSKYYIDCGFSDLSNYIESKFQNKKIRFVGSNFSYQDINVNWKRYHYPRDECAAVIPDLHIGLAHNASYHLLNPKLYEKIEEFVSASNESHEFIYVYGELDEKEGITLFLASGEFPQEDKTFEYKIKNT